MKWFLPPLRSHIRVLFLLLTLFGAEGQWSHMCEMVLQQGFMTQGPLLLIKLTDIFVKQTKDAEPLPGQVQDVGFFKR